MADLVEISEREVLAAAKAWRAGVVLGRLSLAEADLVNAVNLLIERERVAASLSLDTGAVPRKDES